MVRKLILATALMAALAPAAWAGSTATSTASADARSKATATNTTTVGVGVDVNSGGGQATVNASNIPSIAWGSIGLAGLASGDGCVLSQTHSLNAMMTVAGFGGGAGYGDGKTTPYDECNERLALAVLQELKPGTILCPQHDSPMDQCHPVEQVEAMMMVDLTGVRSNLDKLNGKAPPPPAQVSALPQTPAPLPEQTASLDPMPRCSNDNWPQAMKASHGCN